MTVDNISLHDRRRSAERKRGSAQPQNAERKRGSAQPQNAERKRGSAQPQNAERKRGSAQPQNAERKRGSAQPQKMTAATVMRARHYLVRGRVQGVGYRYFALDAAEL